MRRINSSPINHDLKHLITGYMYRSRVALAATAVKYNAYQILNPANSIYVLALKSLSGYLGTAGLIQAVPSTVALATAQDHSVSLRDGSAGLTGYLFSDKLDALDTLAWEYYVTVTRAKLNDSDWFYMLDPGEGLTFECKTVNIAMTLELEFFTLSDSP